MEMWDVLDHDGNKTDRMVARDQWHTLATDDEYMLAVHVYIYNANGEFLIQKRSEDKVILPGMWDITGGAVKAGEDSRSGALREVQEEIGIRLDADRMRVVTRFRRAESYCFVDIWFAQAEFQVEDCVLQPEEVTAVRWVSAADLLRTVTDGESRDDGYENVVENELKRLGF